MLLIKCANLQNLLSCHKKCPMQDDIIRMVLNIFLSLSYYAFVCVVFFILFPFSLSYSLTLIQIMFFLAIWMVVFSWAYDIDIQFSLKRIWDSFLYVIIYWFRTLSRIPRIPMTKEKTDVIANAILLIFARAAKYCIWAESRFCMNLQITHPFLYEDWSIPINRRVVYKWLGTKCGKQTEICEPLINHIQYLNLS